MNRVSRYIDKAKKRVDFVLGSFMNISQVIWMSPSPYYEEIDASILLVSSLMEYAFAIWMSIKEGSMMYFFYPPLLLWAFDGFVEEYMFMCGLIINFALSFALAQYIKRRKKSIYRMFRRGGKSMRKKSLITAVVMLSFGCWKFLYYGVYYVFSVLFG